MPVTELRERTERLLAFAGLTEFKDRWAVRLSGGMQKKLALACTLIHEPEILLLDEPTTGVDPVSRREFWDILTELHLEGVTLFVSTPYMDEAERCSRVGMMYQGRLVICDNPDNIKSMVPGQLIALWTSDMRRAKEIVSDLDGVLEVQTYGDQLRIFINEGFFEDGRDLNGHLQSTLSAANIEILEMRRTQPRMEEAFISLISSQQSAVSFQPDVSGEENEK